MQSYEASKFIVLEIYAERRPGKALDLAESSKFATSIENERYHIERLRQHL